MGILVGLVNQKRGRNSLSQSEERRELKMRDLKNIRVILLRDLTSLANMVIGRHGYTTGIPIPNQQMDKVMSSTKEKYSYL